MLLSTPFIPLFSCTTILGTLMTLTLTSWPLTWLSLELNLLSFIPLMTSTKSFQETESAVKYFLAQAFGSTLLLLSTVALPSLIFCPLILTMSLLLKLGAAPLHSWFPNTINGMAWPSALILSTWQKLGPLFLLTTLPFITLKLIMHLTIILSALIGGTGIMNQTLLRPILAYSSITHTSWMMALTQTSFQLMTLYFFIYTLLLTPIMLTFNTANLHSIKQCAQFTSSPNFLTTSMMLSLLSLGGLPPLPGFVPKMMALNSLISSNQTCLTLPLIIGSLLNMYMYLLTIFTLILQPKISFSLLPSLSPSPLFPVLATSSLALMPLIPSLLM